mmetsp:Transcript_45026/g.102717  ORF Transcript_45026/g.102717 Transcript_45026/m.102717 type:complete len:248 (-) Transcript_45026:50-793(-)
MRTVVPTPFVAGCQQSSSCCVHQSLLEMLSGRPIFNTQACSSPTAQDHMRLDLFRQRAQRLSVARHRRCKSLKFKLLRGGSLVVRPVPGCFQVDESCNVRGGERAPLELSARSHRCWVYILEIRAQRCKIFCLGMKITECLKSTRSSPPVNLLQCLDVTETRLHIVAVQRDSKTSSNSSFREEILFQKAQRLIAQQNRHCCQLLPGSSKRLAVAVHGLHIAVGMKLTVAGLPQLVKANPLQTGQFPL